MHRAKSFKDYNQLQKVTMSYSSMSLICKLEARYLLYTRKQIGACILGYFGFAQT